MGLHLVADMEVDKVADRVADKKHKKKTILCMHENEFLPHCLNFQRIIFSRQNACVDNFVELCLPLESNTCVYMNYTKPVVVIKTITTIVGRSDFSRKWVWRAE